MLHTTRRTAGALGVLLTSLALSACFESDAVEPNSPLLPPAPPSNPKIISAAWNMDVNRLTGKVRVTPPKSGIENAGQLQVIADYFGVEPGSPDLSILAGDVVEIVADNATFQVSQVGEYIPNQVRTRFNVAIRNKLNVVNIIRPTFPQPPAEATGVVLFPFEIVVTETPGGVNGGQGDGTDVIVELPSRVGLIQPSIDWDVNPFNFFNDTGCGPTSNDCYRYESFNSAGGPFIAGGATSEYRTIGFDHDPTVSQFRVRMIVAGDIENATPNTPPVAEAGGPYSGSRNAPFPLSGSATDTDPGATIVRYSWNFDADPEFEATGANAQYTCSSAGSFPISLEVEDDRGATDTDDATVTCTDAVPTVDAGGPYPGFTGVGITVNATGSDDGSSLAYAWDLDNNGSFETAGQSATYTCTATGAFTIGVQVTDDAAQTATDVATVNCAASPDGTVRARWVDGTGTPITTATVGQSVFLEVDVQMNAGRDISTFAADITYGSLVAGVQESSVDLVCSAGASCPSATPVPAGNTDRMNQLVTNENYAAGVARISTYHISASTAVGIQGLARIGFTASAAGAVNPTLVVNIATDLASVNLNLNVATIPTLTIN